MTSRGRQQAGIEPTVERVMGAIGAGPAEDGRSRRKSGSRRSVAPRRRASQRLSELIRLAGLRRHRKALVDFDKFAFALAATLGSASAGTYPIGKAGRWATWPGLDLVSLAESMREAGFERLDLNSHDGDRLGWAMDDVAEHAPASLYSGLASILGRVVQLTAEERILCSIRTIDAIDETVTERRKRVRSSKLERDRERQRTKRAGTSKPHSESAERRKPWEAEGIARSTYYKRQRTRLAPSVEVATSATNQSNGVSNEVVGRATKQSRSGRTPPAAAWTNLSRTHEINRSGDKSVRRQRGDGHPAQSAAAGSAPPPPSSIR